MVISSLYHNAPRPSKPPLKVRGGRWSYAYWIAALSAFGGGILAMTLIPTAAHALTLRNTSNNLGLVAYYSLNDGTSTKATDFSGNGNTGTLTNFALTGTTSNWVDGKKSKALAFDGTDDYVDIGSGSNISFPNVGDKITISFWAKNTTSTASYRKAVTRVNSGNASLRDYDFGLETNSKMTFVYNNDSTLYNIFSSTNAYTDTSSYHLFALTYTYGTGSSMQFYYDGVAVGGSWTDRFGNDSPITGSAKTFIGGNNVVNEYWTGSVDDVRVYNRALSATEIANMYNSGIAKVTGANDTGLVGYWPMDENKGTKSGDYSGNNNTGTLTNGPTWVAGRRGKALSFDGNDDTVNLGTGISQAFTSLTLSAWIKATNNGNSLSIIERSSFADAGGLGMIISSNGYIQCPTFQHYLWSDNVADVDDGTWHHIVCTLESNGTGNIYIDGVFVRTAGGSTVATSSAETYIGARGGASLRFNGSIDDVRIYNRALSATDVLNLYNSTKVGATRVMTVSDTGLVGYWNLDDGTSTKATDFSGQGNTGTLTNMEATDWVTGKRGKALTFDGTNEYVSATDNFPLSSDDISISFWIYLTGHGAWTSPVKKSGGTSNSNLFDFGVMFFNGADTICPVRNGNGPCASTGGIARNRWVHVVVTMGASNSKVYFDGTLDSTLSPAPTGYANTSGRPVVLMGDSEGNGVTGSIDDVRIYNRVLSATEIQTLYTIGR